MVAIALIVLLLLRQSSAVKLFFLLLDFLHFARRSRNCVFDGGRVKFPPSRLNDVKFINVLVPTRLHFTPKSRIATGPNEKLKTGEASVSRKDVKVGNKI